MDDVSALTKGQKAKPIVLGKKDFASSGDETRDS